MSKKASLTTSNGLTISFEWLNSTFELAGAEGPLNFNELQSVLVTLNKRTVGITNQRLLKEFADQLINACEGKED